MVFKVKVEGFEAFEQKVKDLQSSHPQHKILVLFSGSKDPKTQQSWCPDCVTAEPVVEACMEQSGADDLVLLYVGVGPRDFWKDPNCIFRSQPSTQLKSVPTLIKWGTSQRLEESQCNRPDMIELMFED